METWAPFALPKSAAHSPLGAPIHPGIETTSNSAFNQDGDVVGDYPNPKIGIGELIDLLD